MVLHTRRRVLHVAAAVTGGLAGCSGLAGEASHSSRSSETAGATPATADGTTAPATLVLRNESGRPPIELPDADRADADAYPRERRGSRVTNELLDDADGARGLGVGDANETSVLNVDGDGSESDTGGDAGESGGGSESESRSGAGDPVAAFVAATDFDAETLYLETVRVEQCFRLRLCRIGWGAHEVRTDYTRELRPYDERCTADAIAFESRLVRLPVALDADSVNSFSASIGGGGRCDAQGARAEGSGSSGSGSSAGGSDGSSGGER